MGNKKSAFTLVEVLVVTILVGLLSTFLLFNGTFVVDKSDKTNTLVEIGVYQIAIESAIRTSTEPITSLQSLADKINSEVSNTFRVRVVDNYLEAISYTNRLGDKYEIHTSDYIRFLIECGEYVKEICVTKEDGLYEERVYVN